MERFFIEPDAVEMDAHQIHVTGSPFHHMRNVLRHKAGDEVLALDGTGMEYHCTIRQVLPNEAILDITYAQPLTHELPCRISLFQGLPKSDKMDLIIQKAVELGAAAIVPVVTHRSVVRLEGDKAAKKEKRWQAIAEGAAEQSGRSFVPPVESVVSFPKALEMAKDLDVVLLPYELAEGMQETRRILSAIAPGQSIGIFIGPEGGFEPSEVEDAQKAGALVISLGKRILRTETAGMALLAHLMMCLDGLS